MGRSAGNDPHRTGDLPGVKNRPRIDGDGMENAGRSPGHRYRSGMPAARPGAARGRDRDACAGGRLGVDSRAGATASQSLSATTGDLKLQRPDPGGSGRSPSALIAVMGAIILVTDHERQCRRNSIRTGHSAPLTSCQLAIDLQRVVGDLAGPISSSSVAELRLSRGETPLAITAVMQADSLTRITMGLASAQADAPGHLRFCP